MKFRAMTNSNPRNQLPKIGARWKRQIRTQWEYGRTYLYIEHGQRSLTTVDITEKRNPRSEDPLSQRRLKHDPRRIPALS